MKMDPNYLALYEEALRYGKVGDDYTAKKLLKKVTRLVPDWPEAYRALGQLYADRKEWKPAFHYLSKSLGLDADDRETWWLLGLAATGLGKLRTANTVWAKFGFGKTKKAELPAGLQLTAEGGYEIVWMQPLDAGRGRIVSIPNPATGMYYRDLMLYDRRGQKASQVIGKRRYPIYAVVDRIKKSPYQTFSCLLHTGAEEHIRQLEQLCYDAGLGFEVWSNATRTLQITPKAPTDAQRKAYPEYYGDLLPKGNGDTALVALAAIHPAEVERVLNAWQMISLADYSDLKNYRRNESRQ